MQRKIPRRKRIFVGCEGDSERGYAALLQRFANDSGRAVHIEARILSRAGDPLALVRRALLEIELGEQQHRQNFKARFLLFDTDRVGQNPSRDQEMKKLAKANGLILVRQDVCFESMLLRHFAGHEYDHPPSSLEALKKLKSVWQGYEKGMPALDLKKRIRTADVRRAASSPHNSDLHKLLVAIGLSNGRSSKG